MALLNTSPVKGKEQLAEKLWECGCLSLVLLVKQQRQVSDTVLQSLSDRIIAGQNVIQYTSKYSNYFLFKTNNKILSHFLRQLFKNCLCYIVLMMKRKLVFVLYGGTKLLY